MFRTTIQTTDLEELERILDFIRPHLDGWHTRWDVTVVFNYRRVNDEIEWYKRYVISIPKKWLRDRSFSDMIEMIKDGAYS